MTSIQRVVHVGPNLLPVPPPRGGAIERKMFGLARAQVAMGLDAAVVAVEAGVPQQGSPHPELVELPYRNRGTFGLAAAAWIARRRPDVVHIHSRPEIAFALRAFGYRGLIALSFNYPLLLPHVVHRHAGGGYERGVGVGLTHVIDLFLPESGYAADQFLAIGGRLPRERTAVLWNGTEWSSAPLVQRSGRPTALFVGRFVEQKGADLFAAASAHLEDWDFVAVGPVGEFHDAGGQRRSLELGRVDHRGPQSDEVVADLMARATCLVLPTREWEVFGMVLVEALALGTPVVVSDAGGPPEILAGCPGTHFFPVGDEDALVKAIEEAAGDSDDVREEAQLFASRFAWPALANRSLELYTRAFAQRESRRHSKARAYAHTVAEPTTHVPESSRSAVLALVDRMSAGFVQPSLLAWRACEAPLYQVPSEGAVLDLGAGLGHFTREIAPDAIALDMDFAQLRTGMETDAFSKAVCADIGALPFREGSFSTVVSNCVLEHLEDLDGALSEIGRVLTTSGTLQTTVPLEQINTAYVLPLGRYRDMRNRQLAHRTLLDIAGWRGRFAAHGFEVVRDGPVVSRAQGRRWDILDAPLFARVAGKTIFGGYTKLLDRFPSLRRTNRVLTRPLARWVIGAPGGTEPICAFIEMRKP